MKTVLFVEDESKIREVVTAYLTNKGFRVIACETGAEALRAFSCEDITIAVLDLMLPDISGEEICTRIRKQSSLPVIMLTAKTAESDLLNGLKIGADDYITKPFSLKELAARIETVLRRSEGNRPAASTYSWNHDDLVVDFENNAVSKCGVKVVLTASEWKLLGTLVRNPQKTFTREELISLVFGLDFDGYDRAVDTHIKNLRKKIETDTKAPQYILTVHGIGYKFGGEE